MIMSNANKRFILSTVINQILTDSDQVRIYFSYDTYSASFFITADTEDSKRLHVTFCELNVKEKVHFELSSWDSLLMIFKIIDDLTFGNGMLQIQRGGCKVLTMNLAD